ncbi:SCO family protein [Aestuariibius sp. 2305UL40-4]|uniref:SCO family protein n=1 Tax=Aestuariibius violaceus TaxID=3234132 RepID=UPI00398EFA7A
MKSLLLVAVGVGTLAAITGAAWLMRPTVDEQFAQCTGSAVAGGDIGGPFELVSETGETVTDADVITKPSLVYFGYTFCPDVCPLDSARNAEAIYLLEEQGVDAQAVFISVDPQRDTPEVVRDFTDVFHDDMIGLTGSEEQVAAASRAYRTYYRAEPADDPYYLVDHSTQTYLVLPEHGFVEFFRREATAEQIAQTTACFSAAAG